MITAAVVGAAGYTGVELVRLLAAHPEIDLVAATSGSEAGRPVGEVYPSLAELGMTFVEPDMEAIAGIADVVFLAVPHTAALALAPSLLEAGCRVIDLSADFRLADPESYEEWYGTQHTAADLLDTAVYGLPELHRADIVGAELVACPGCYPTATLIASAPALGAGLVKAGRVLVDAKSGVSGAGRTPTATTHFCAVDGSVSAYNVGVHRHTPEMAQELSALAGEQVAVSFAPHLVPMSRGLLATVWLEAQEGVTSEVAHAAYTKAYADEPFVSVSSPGKMPATAEVRGTNRAHVGVTVDAAGMLVACCAIDNLVKGAGGQAIQCANIACGLGETAGLNVTAPVV